MKNSSHLSLRPVVFIDEIDSKEQRMLGICFTKGKLCRALLHLLLILGGGISCRDVTEIGGVSGIVKTQIGKLNLLASRTKV
ncbi:unnamed protein product [Eruca vesicaria subsp. sativa]|uniref:Uncharacterized protein n=1 Tax=Eruca vesicaria subsp. sativa TaxID=29727 RepID=A0ABC8LP60_ERUVS|nr:unnamed protein product [Eruca vesicaria subsp. sativa]